MRPILLLGSISLMALFTCTTLDQPLEEVKESDSKSDDSFIDWDSRYFKDEKANLRNSTTDKWNHSRMLMKTSTTVKFPDWWIFTTRRPIISYKDYPGKPGVATWKEISPIENRRSRKLKNPTAEQVSSFALRPSSYLLHSIVYAIIGTLIGLYYVR